MHFNEAVGATVLLEAQDLLPYRHRIVSPSVLGLKRLKSVVIGYSPFRE